MLGSGAASACGIDRVVGADVGAVVGAVVVAVGTDMTTSLGARRDAVRCTAGPAVSGEPYAGGSPPTGS
ncbi:hypothetical protein GCM10009814_26580 [Lapillicoccus jejuensis]